MRRYDNMHMCNYFRKTTTLRTNPGRGWVRPWAAPGRQPISSFTSVDFLSSGSVTSLLPTCSPPTARERKYLPSSSSWPISILVHSPTLGAWSPVTTFRPWSWLSAPRRYAPKTICGGETAARTNASRPTSMQSATKVYFVRIQRSLWCFLKKDGRAIDILTNLDMKS